jgi:hypothetical protein
VEILREFIHRHDPMGRHFIGPLHNELNDVRCGLDDCH